MPRKNSDLTAAEKRALDAHIEAEAVNLRDAPETDPRFATTDAEREAVDRAFAPADSIFDNGGASDAPSVPANASGAAVSADSTPSGINTPPAPATPASGPHNTPSDADRFVPNAMAREMHDPDNTLAPAAPFLDLSKADEAAALIPKYTRVLVACRSCDAVISKSGNPMLNYRVTIERVIAPPRDTFIDPAIAVMWTKRAIFGRFMLTPPNPVTGSRGTIGSTRAAFEAFGVPWAPRQFATADDVLSWLREVAPLFVGSIAEATIGVETPDPTKPESYDPATGELWPDKNSVYGFKRYDPAKAQAPIAGGPAVRNPVRSVPQSIDSDEDLPF